MKTHYNCRTLNKKFKSIYQFKERLVMIVEILMRSLNLVFDLNKDLL